jgi:N6-L-threonylcarbamoyladenine synthase
MKILAIETSCDETAAAIVEHGTTILSSTVASSKTMHEKYGGIMPEVAAREQLRCIVPTIKEVLSESNLTYSQLDAIAVTVGPGLVGSLLVGVETAKAIALTTGLPIIPVNHVLAHMYANLVHTNDYHPITFPAISLVVSGGHTELYLMKSESELTWLGGTLDDAAGEAFDKTARLLGFGHGGGPAIAKAAEQVHSSSVSLPRPLNDTTLHFSFSGLKTAVLREWKKQTSVTATLTSEFAYEVQEAITDVLVKKTLLAARTHNAHTILLSGGVSANLRLREKLADRGSEYTIHAPPIHLCTDNAVYIASYAYFRGKPIDWHKLTAIPDLSVEE